MNKASSEFRERVLAIKGGLEVAYLGKILGFNVYVSAFGLNMSYGMGPTEDEAWECALHNLTAPYDPDNQFWKSIGPNWERRCVN